MHFSNFVFHNGFCQHLPVLSISLIFEEKTDTIKGKNKITKQEEGKYAATENTYI